MSSRAVVFVTVAIALIVGVGCASGNSDKGARERAELRGPPKAQPLAGAPTVAVQGVDAPGFNINDLTARLRDALVHTSGVPVVDVLSVRAEIAACHEMPCKDTEQERFKEASLVASATVSRVGTTLIGSLRIQRGIHEIVRVNAQGTDAGAVVAELGLSAGRELRSALTSSAPTGQEAPSEER